MSLVAYNAAGNNAHYTAPPAPSSRTGLICIQEWWGLNPHIKSLATKLAAATGAHTIAPDLYHGRVATTQDEAEHLMKGLDWGEAVLRIRDAAMWLRREKGVRAIVVTGWCMGGALALKCAVDLCEETGDGRVDGAAPFYGIPPGLDVHRIRVPVQAHFAELDHHKGFADIESSRKLEAAMQAAGVKHEFYIYQGAGHAFMNESRPEAFNGECAKVATERLARFVGAVGSEI